jgi:flagella basal body P-ring formation protein FlgA
MRRMVVLPFLIGSVAACALVDGDRILGRDLARIDARYASAPPDLVAGFSPVAGSQRLLDIRRLTLIARQHGIAVEGLAPMCFERPTELLSAAKLQPALERALGSGGKIEILDFSRQPIPTGELLFSVRDLIRPPATFPDAPVIWRGQLRYGSRSTTAVWAKVRVLKLERWIETEKAIAAHAIIQPDQIAAKSGWRFPFATAALADVERAIGKQATRSMAAGLVINPTMLELPHEIERGETVDVEVVSGGVSLRFTARAETSGRRNETVVVLETATGKRYQGRVQQKGKVLIDADTRRKTDVVRRRFNPARTSEPVDSGGEAEEAQGDRTGATGSLPG